MQEYYNKKAKECEAAVQELQQRVASMDAESARSLQDQMVKVQREMKNYKAAVAAANR